MDTLWMLHPTPLVLLKGRNTNTTQQDHCRVSDFSAISLVGIY